MIARTEAAAASQRATAATAAAATAAAAASQRRSVAIAESLVLNSNSNSSWLVQPRPLRLPTVRGCFSYGHDRRVCDELRTTIVHHVNVSLLYIHIVRTTIVTSCIVKL